MNPNYKHTITLYNCCQAEDGSETWYRHVMRDCFYKAKVARSEADIKLTAINTYTVRIPQSVRYKPYSEWKALSNEQRKEFFTISNGDIIVYGACEDIITGSGDGAAAKVLSRNKPDAFKVTAHSDNTAAYGPHYKAGG